MPKFNRCGQASALPKGIHCAITAALLLLTAAVLAADPVASSKMALRDAISFSKNQARPPQLSREMLLNRGAISEVQLSPDGRYLSLRWRGPQQTDLLLQDLASGAQTRLLADIGELDVTWSGDSQRLWLVDNDGLAVFDLTARQAKRILKWDADRRQRFFSVDTRAPAYALISERIGTDGHWQYRYLRVDSSGNTTLLYEASQPLREALLAEDGSLAFTAAYGGAQYDTVIRRHHSPDSRNISATSEELLRCQGIERCRLLDYSGTKQALWLLAHHGEDQSTLQRWQASDRRWQTVHRDPAGIADVSSVLWQQDAETWLAIAYQPDRRHWYGNGANNEAALAALRRQLAGANLSLTTSADGKRWLVQAWRATWQADRYYLYHPAAQTLRPLFASERDTAPLAKPEQLADAVPFDYRARDGMVLHGYVYLPLGIAPEKAPLIANIHGGPFNRERDSYDAVTQLLVNRGYAVFTPNFRASTGYGMHYMRASNGDFGNGKVLGDILDGLDFLLAQGIGDASQQAIVGHSFGGYASLLAVSHQPTRFRFAVASAAPVEFSWGMQWIAANGGSALPEDGPPAELFFAQHGVRMADPAWREQMRRDSPLQQLENLRAPVYLWAGGQDDRVPLKQIVSYAGEAKRRGKTLSLLIDPETGHNPRALLNLEAIVYLLESAADRHFSGGLTPPSTRLQQFLNQNLRIDDGALRQRDTPAPMAR